MSNLNILDPVIIPHWVAKQLTRNGLGYADVFDLDRLSKVCSPEDLVHLYQLNKNSDRVFGIKVFSGLDDHWRTTYPASFSALQTHCSYVGGDELMRLACEPVGEKGGYEVVSFKTNLNQHSTVVAAVLHPGFYSGDNVLKERFSLIKSILETSYVFAKYHELAGTALFRPYVSGLVN